MRRGGYARFSAVQTRDRWAAQAQWQFEHLLDPFWRAYVDTAKRALLRDPQATEDPENRDTDDENRARMTTLLSRMFEDTVQMLGAHLLFDLEAEGAVAEFRGLPAAEAASAQMQARTFALWCLNDALGELRPLYAGPDGDVRGEHEAVQGNGDAGATVEAMRAVFCKLVSLEAEVCLDRLRTRL